jgi:hypothetical protein
LNARDYEAAIEREVAEWPGVTLSWEQGAKHPRVVFAFGEQSQFRPYPGTPSDRRGLDMKVTEIRRVLTEMGAARNPRPKSTRERSERNPGADMREMPGGEPAPVIADPWATLRAANAANRRGMVIHEQFEQGSQQWMDARCGLISASEVKLILNPPPKEETRVKKDGSPYKQREWNIVADDDACRKHLYELAAQRITKFVEPIFQTFDMIRGQNDEAEARAQYAERFGPVRQVGLITNDKWGFTLAYSPDGLPIDESDGRGGIEIKSRKQKYQVQTIVEYAQTGAIPAEFIMQHQHGMLVAELDWIDFCSFSAKLPMSVIRVHPDEQIQAAILEAAEAAEAKIAQFISIYQEQFA